MPSVGSVGTVRLSSVTTTKQESLLGYSQSQLAFWLRT